VKLQAFRDASRGLKRYETGETVKEISARTGMRESDVFVLLPGWEWSRGTLDERIEAVKHFIPIYKWPKDIEALRNHISARYADELLSNIKQDI